MNTKLYAIGSADTSLALDVDVQSAPQMAGTKSKGCRTCVKRRVKCDERRPVCLRCDKAKVQCNGHRELEVFVNYALHAIQETKSKSPYPSSEGIRPNSSDQSAIYPPHPPQELSLVGTNDSTYFQHLLCSFFAMGQESENPGHCGNRTWMLACLRNEQNMPTSTIAMRCLATSFFWPNTWPSSYHARWGLPVWVSIDGVE